jgi:hypothetical protein
MIAGITGRTWAKPPPAFPDAQEVTRAPMPGLRRSFSRDDVKGVRGTRRLTDGWQIVKRADYQLAVGDAYGAAVEPLGRRGPGDHFFHPWDNWNGGSRGSWSRTNWVNDALAWGSRTQPDD